MGEQREITTKDMAMVAYLSMLPFEPVRMVLDDEQGRREAVWVFESSDELKKVIKNYRAGKCTVEPKSFILRQAEIRKRMFNWLDDPHGNDHS